MERKVGNLHLRLLGLGLVSAADPGIRPEGPKTHLGTRFYGENSVMGVHSPFCTQSVVNGSLLVPVSSKSTTPEGPV